MDNCKIVYAQVLFKEVDPDIKFIEAVRLNSIIILFPKVERMSDREMLRIGLSGKMFAKYLFKNAMAFRLGSYR
jgi:hypothetical protein